MAGVTELQEDTHSIV